MLILQCMIIQLIIIVTVCVLQVITFIVLFIQLNILGNSEVSAFVFLLNEIFIQFYSFHIFNALTFILHASNIEQNTESLVLRYKTKKKKMSINSMGRKRGTNFTKFSTIYKSVSDTCPFLNVVLPDCHSFKG